MARLVSSPTRSSKLSGPIGKLQPPCIAASMSSRLATPASSSFTALFRYGKSRALTMKPAWSRTSTTVLPHCSAKPRAVATVSSDVVTALTTSTRLITGAGLKKWMPHTRSGRLVATDPVELGEEVGLRGQVLDDRLEHEVAGRELAEVGHDLESAQRRGPLGVVE